MKKKLTKYKQKSKTKTKKSDFYIFTFTIMKKEEIYNTIKSLARSQGCWGRLLYEWEEAGITDEALEELENMNFKSMLDVIMFLEGNY